MIRKFENSEFVIYQNKKGNIIYSLASFGYTGTGVEYEWIKLEKNLDKNAGDNMIDSVYDTFSIEEKEGSTIVKLRY